MSRHLIQLCKIPILAATLGMLASCAGTVDQPSGPAPDRSSLSGNGPYQIRAYQSAPVPEQYASATIYYPLDKPSAMGGVAIAPGYTERQRHINWWGGRLASHGFAVLVLDTNDPEAPPEQRAAALTAAVDTLRAENDRRESPLFERLDPQRMAVMGHSMGGGGALLAADRNNDALAAALALTPWQPDGSFAGIAVPTLIIAGENDRIAPVAEHAWPHFQSLPAGTPRAYLEVASGDHFIGNNRAEYLHPLMSRYAVAWLKRHVDGDQRYHPFIHGEPVNRDSSRFSRLVTEPGESSE